MRILVSGMTVLLSVLSVNVQLILFRGASPRDLHHYIEDIFGHLSPFPAD